MRLRAVALVLVAASLAGAAKGQAQLRCVAPHSLIFAGEVVLDLVAAREVCGRDEPEMRAAAQELVDDVLATVARMLGPAYAARLRDDVARFAEARRRIYDNRAPDMAAACRAEAALVAGAPETVALLQELRREMALRTAPGGELSQPDCRDP